MRKLLVPGAFSLSEHPLSNLFDKVTPLHLFHEALEPSPGLTDVARKLMANFVEVHQ